MTAPTLKPCPFCGSEDVSVQEGEQPFVFCGGCGCEGPWSKGTSAAERWNAAPRPPAPATQGYGCQRVERVVMHAECACGEKAVAYGEEDPTEWLCCGKDCTGGPVVLTRVSFAARAPEQSVDRVNGEASEVEQ